MKLSSLTAVGFCANMMLDRREQALFTIAQFEAAVKRRDLTPILIGIDDSGSIALHLNDPQGSSDLNAALCDAGEALLGRSLRKAGVGDNALCLLLACVLEAIQQNFC